MGGAYCSLIKNNPRWILADFSSLPTNTVTMTDDSRMISSSVENPSSGEQAQYSAALRKTLEETENAVLDLAGVDSRSSEAASWQRARQIVEELRPVPWFIWRLSNFVLGTSGVIHNVPEGLVFGLRRLLFAAASDPIIGTGQKVDQVPKALKVLAPDVVAAVGVMHAMCRKLASKHLDRMWRPILDDALIRAQIGFHAASNEPQFGKGRGMLAGFAGRVGLVILIACGDEAQAQKALEEIASGADAKKVAHTHYGCDAMQVSAMTLSAAGCGRDCAFGTVNYAMDRAGCLLPEAGQARWLAAFDITEHVRTGTTQQVGEDTWEFLQLTSTESREKLAAEAKKCIRRGHGWQWML